jgi:DNA primase
MTDKSQPTEQPICPFHGNQKIPLSVEFQHAHCSVCGWHGDLVALAMQTEGISFREAIERRRDQIA